jgi:hypothetical protein
MPAAAILTVGYPVSAETVGPWRYPGRTAMADSVVSYEIRVGGRLGETIRSAFPHLRARTHGADTILAGALADRAALYGVIAQMESLGLELIEVRRLAPG